MAFLFETRGRAEAPAGPVLLVIEEDRLVSRRLGPLCDQLGVRMERLAPGAQPESVLASRRPFALAASDAPGTALMGVLERIAGLDPALPVLLLGSGGDVAGGAERMAGMGLTAILRVGRFPGIGDLADLLASARDRCARACGFDQADAAPAA